MKRAECSDLRRVCIKGDMSICYEYVMLCLRP